MCSEAKNSNAACTLLSKKWTVKVKGTEWVGRTDT